MGKADPYAIGTTVGDLDLKIRRHEKKRNQRKPFRSGQGAIRADPVSGTEEITGYYLKINRQIRKGNPFLMQRFLKPCLQLAGHLRNAVRDVRISCRKLDVEPFVADLHG